ncbi:reverse transcriptase domain-containing protein [Tanacetum coccineum]
MYRVFSLMLKSFSREDLEDLYKLVKAKYKSTRPVEDLDLVLWSDLKTMFKPHVEDEIWKLQQRYRVLSWKLFESCGVHCLSLQSGMIYTLVEKRYPLTPPIITDMLNKKLQGRIVGIKSLLNAVSITAALIDVNVAQSKLVLLENFNENYSKCLRLLYKVNAAEGVNAASEEVSTAELVSTAYVIWDSKLKWKIIKPRQKKEAERALNDMKKQMAKLPTLTALIEGKTLIMYVFAAEEAISVVLLAERANLGFGARDKKTEEVLPSPHSGNNHGPAIAGLRIMESMEVKHIEAFVDSKLIANQINDLYQAKEDAMQRYLSKAKDLITRFRSFSITQVPRSQNKQVVPLSNMAILSFAFLNKKVCSRSITCNVDFGKYKIMAIVEETGNTWMTPIKLYLENGTLLEERGKAWRLRARSKQYALLEGTFYRESFLEPWLRCVGLEHANYAIHEIHEGSCSIHSGPRSVVTKAMQLGYYWTTMHTDARMIIKAC